MESIVLAPTLLHFMQMQGFMHNLIYRTAAYNQNFGYFIKDNTTIFFHKCLRY